MTAYSVTQRGRAFAQSLMIDACSIQHPIGSTTDPTTGQVVKTYTTVYTGPCRVSHEGAPSGQDVAEAHLAVLNPVVSVPATVTGVAEEDLLTITACVLDPEMVGKKFRVKGPVHYTYLTSRRLHCTEATS